MITIMVPCALPIFFCVFPLFIAKSKVNERHKGKGTRQRVLSTHSVSHSQLAAYYKYQS